MRPSGPGHDAVDHREPEPRALVLRLRREERLEDARLHFGLMPVPSVRDLEDDVLGRAETTGPLGGRHGRLGRRDDQPPAVGHRVAAVRGEVRAAPARPGRAPRLDVPEVRGALTTTPRSWTAATAAASARSARTRARSITTGGAWLPAAEGQQLARDAAPPGRRPGRGARASCCRVRRSGRSVLQLLDVATDDGQHVVEVVREAAGELADGFELLRVAQLPLEFVALRDVPAVQHDAVDRGLGRWSLETISISRQGPSAARKRHCTRSGIPATGFSSLGSPSSSPSDVGQRDAGAKLAVLAQHAGHRGAGVGHTAVGATSTTTSDEFCTSDLNRRSCSSARRTGGRSPSSLPSGDP